jgi:hypothetical protein
MLIFIFLRRIKRGYQRKSTNDRSDNLTNSPGKISEKEVKALETKKLILISRIEANKQLWNVYSMQAHSRETVPLSRK